MSHIMGTGLAACLVAGGLDAPDVVTRRRAVGHILKGYYFFGDKVLESGWRECLREAMMQLDPDVQAHLDEHEDPGLTLKLFGGDPFNDANNEDT